MKRRFPRSSFWSPGIPSGVPGSRRVTRPGRANGAGILFGFIVWVLLVSSSFAADPRKMIFSPVQFHPPRAERVALENGMVVYLLEDHELPLIRMEAIIRTGSVYEPAEKIGLAALTGIVMRTGGTSSISGDALDDELEFMAADMGSGIGLDDGSAALDILKKDFDRGLALFADMLMHPAFPQEKLDLAKQQALESIRRRNDSPGGIASRRFAQQVYGPDHPFARESSVGSIGRITRDDLVSFHSAYYYANAVILSVSGDFERNKMIEKIRRTFADWPSKKIDLPSLPPIREPFQPSVNLVEKDISQTHLRIGHLGIRQADPDFFAVTLMDDILGSGGFRSRLFKSVRTDRGLAYSVGCAFTPGILAPGLFVAYAQTKAESTDQTIAAMEGEIARIRTEPVTAEELRLSKDSFLNSFVFSFSNSAQIVSRQALLEYYGFPPDYLERFRDGVVTVTAKEIQRVAQKHIHPDGLIILAVGRSDRFDQPLSKFGPVNLIPLEPTQEPAREPVGAGSER
jgi:zinc protease